jgi:hypothetical protein
MSLRVTTSNIETGIVLLHPAGHMTIGPETDNLEWLLRSLLREGQTKLILDLAGVDQIDALFLVRCFFRRGGLEPSFVLRRQSQT